MNKNLLITVLALIVWNTSIAASISQLIKQNKITATFKALNAHSGRCIEAEFTNISKENITNTIGDPLLLCNQDTTAQSIIITNEPALQLARGEKKKFMLQGCCIENSKRCPTLTDQFTPKTSTNQNLIRLVRAMNKSSVHGFAEQAAVWAITDNNDIENINGEDSSNVMLLRNLVGSIKGIKVPAYLKDNYCKSGSVVNSSLEIETSGKLVLTGMKANDNIETALYDADGMVVSEVIKDKCLQPYGKITVDRHKHHFHLLVANLRVDKKYYLRVKVNGVIQKEFMYSA